MSTYNRSSAPNHFSGAAMVMPSRLTSRMVSVYDDPNPPQVIETNQPKTFVTPTAFENIVAAADTEPVEPVEQVLEPVEESNSIPITTTATAVDDDDITMDEDDDDDDSVVTPLPPTTEGHGFGYGYYGYSTVPNAVTIIPVGAGLAEETGLIADELPIIHEGDFPEAEIENTLDNSVPALIVPSEDVIITGGRFGLVREEVLSEHMSIEREMVEFCWEMDFWVTYLRK